MSRTLTIRTFDPLAQAWRDQQPTPQDLAAAAERIPNGLPTLVEAYILDEWLRGQKAGAEKERTEALASAVHAASDLLGGYRTDDELTIFRHGMATIVAVLRARAQGDPPTPLPPAVDPFVVDY